MKDNNYKYTKNCVICNKEFKSNVKTAKYCSYDCRYKASRNRTYKCICTVCGEEFQGASATNKICSPMCRTQIFTHTCKNCGKEYKTGSHTGSPFCSFECKKEYFSENCEYCGKKFIPEHSEDKFCDWICKDRATGKYEKKCANCGNEFRTNYSNSKYCSEECKPILKRLCACCGKIFETTGYKYNYCSKECHSNNDKYIYKLTTKSEKVILLASKEELENHLYNYDKFSNKHREIIKRKLHNIYRAKVKGDMDFVMRKSYLLRKYKPILNININERHQKIAELELNNWELIYKKEE